MACRFTRFARVVRERDNDVTDSEAIATYVRQPDMRFFETNSLDRQSEAIPFKTEQKLVQSRT